MRNAENTTALHLASEDGMTECVELLLQKGADVHVQNDHGKTALELAIRIPEEKWQVQEGISAAASIAEMLLQAGAGDRLTDADWDKLIGNFKQRYTLPRAKLLKEIDDLRAVLEKWRAKYKA